MSDSSATPWTVAHQAPSNHGISQARLLEWVAIYYSRGSSLTRDQTYTSCIGKINSLSPSHQGSPVLVKVAQSCLTLCDPMDFYSPWHSPGQNTGLGSRSLLQGIFPIQGSNPGLLHCRQILKPPGKFKNTGVGSLSLFQG